MHRHTEALPGSQSKPLVERAQDPGVFLGWGSFQGVSASHGLGVESREPWLVFPDPGLALQAPAFPVRVSK